MQSCNVAKRAPNILHARRVKFRWTRKDILPTLKHVWTKRRSLARIAGELKIRKTIQLEFNTKYLCTHPQKLNKLFWIFAAKSSQRIIFNPQKMLNIIVSLVYSILNIWSFCNCYFMYRVSKKKWGLFYDQYPHQIKNKLLDSWQSRVLKFHVPYQFAYFLALLCCTEMGLNMMPKNVTFKIWYFPAI